jgi:hypothetical protein
VADTFDYAATVARDPELARRVAEARSKIASGDVGDEGGPDKSHLALAPTACRMLTSSRPRRGRGGTLRESVRGAG